MSNISVVIANGQFNVPANTFRPKVFDKVVGLDVSALLGTVVPNMDKDSTVKPSNFGLRTSMAKALAGGERAPHDYVLAISYLICRHAWGTALAGLTDKLPAYSVAAITAGCATLKMGAGCTYTQLHDATKVAFDALMALPIKSAKPKAVPAPAVTPAPAPAPETIPGERAEPAGGLTPAELREAVAMLGHGLDNAAATAGEAALLEFESRAKARAQAAADREANNAEFAEQQTAEFARREASIHARACAFAELATFFGIKLSKSQLARLDEAEAKERAAA